MLTTYEKSKDHRQKEQENIKILQTIIDVHYLCVEDCVEEEEQRND